MLPLFFIRDRRGSAVRWFVYAAAAITLSAAAGAHGLAWMVQSGRLPVIAFVPIDRQSASNRQARSVDMAPTGSIVNDPQPR